MEFKLLLDQLQLNLNEISSKNDDMILIAENSINVCRRTLTKMSKLVLENKFTSLEEEINFFKNIKTSPMSQFIYFTRIRAFEIKFSKIGIQEQKEYIKKKLKK